MEATMSNKQQTAVEWLVKQLNIKYGNNDFIITHINEIEQAKEMEKQQQDLLNECEIQLEYLNQKFVETGTTNALLAKLKNK